jgi:hypothetical protein
MARGTLDDLTAAVVFVRGLGATRVLLVGASLGGITTGKVAGRLGAAGVVVLSAPRELSEYDLVVGPDELAAVTGPALFVASEQDDTVPLAATRSTSSGPVSRSGS